MESSAAAERTAMARHPAIRRFVVERLPHDRPVGLRYPIQPALRGIQQVGPLRAIITDPFGLCEFERELIKERVRAGIKNAQANGKEFGRPRRIFDRQRAVDLRGQGMSYPQIARLLGVGQGTIVRAIQGSSAE